MAAEIGRTASKHLSSECGKATSLSGSGGDVGFDSSRVIVGTEQQRQQLQQSRQSPPPPPPQQQLQQQQQQLPQEERTLSATVQIRKTLGKATTTTPLYRNRVPFATVQPAAGNNRQQEQALTNADNVTSTAEAVTEVPGAIKTTINIGFAMNHVNDQENLKQLSLAPVQVNEVEEMDTQEGEYTSRPISQILPCIYLFIYILSFWLFSAFSRSLFLPPSLSLFLSLSLSLSLSIYIYIYIYMYVCMYIYIELCV